MTARDIRQGRAEDTGPDIVRELRRISMHPGLSGYDVRILRTAAEMAQECERRGARIRELERRLALYTSADDEYERTTSGLLEE